MSSDAVTHDAAVGVASRAAVATIVGGHAIVAQANAGDGEAAAAEVEALGERIGCWCGTRLRDKSWVSMGVKKVSEGTYSPALGWQQQRQPELQRRWRWRKHACWVGEEEGREV